MQESRRRTNQERTAATRERLIAAARQLFVEKSYAETSTPEIVARAGLTRGALYHHYADKQSLFHAVVVEEARKVAGEIEARSVNSTTPLQGLLTGGEAFLEAMAVPGRTRLLLLDGPAVLGQATMDQIDEAHGNRTLREGLIAAMQAGQIRRLPPAALAALLGAAYDRAALVIEAGGDAEALHQTLAALLEGLAVEDGG
ncbi:TetR/AcrR family transcriptional regulator [Fodinicurvata sediminis]|uniref:TetR/AcrR family transcriptional regulator n=1 Tax=Fodinicurvata sediminis TaxID=1121832 RepID=UPI0003B47BBD|nr:TetR/AcrR family transcriptional regulator [Fodinicurvata sediminis]